MQRLDVKKITIRLATAVVALVICGWTLPYLSNSILPPIVSASSEFQSIGNWMPLIQSVASGNFFPSQPSINPNIQATHFYPYITLWIGGFIYATVGVSGLVIFGQLLLPLASYMLLIKIFYRHHLPLLWSIAISSVAISAFSAWPLRDFLAGLLAGHNWRDLGVLQPLEIMHFPFPSLPLFIFLILFYLSTRPAKLTSVLVTIYTICWALTTQVHAIDGLFGLVFWFAYFPIRLFRQERSSSIATIKKQMLLQATTALICVLPALISFMGYIEAEKQALGEFATFLQNIGSQASSYYYLVYFVMPLATMALVYLIQRIDKFEILFKFWPIYMLMAIEFTLVSISSLGIILIDFNVIQHRIVLFFLHFYYYVPVLYFVTRPLQTYYSGPEAQQWANKLRELIWLVFNRLHVVYLSVILLLLATYVSSSLLQYSKLQKDESLQFARNEVAKEVELMTSHVSNSDVLVAMPSAASNLVAGKLSLWVSRFANSVSAEDIIKRLALHAKLYGWTRDDFIQFMLPGALHESRKALVDLRDDAIYQSGVGYWLAFQKKVLLPEYKKQYQDKVGTYFDELDTPSAMQVFGVSHVLKKADAPMPPAKHRIIAKTKRLTLCELERN